MPSALRMPKLGLTMQEGTVVEWRCREGEPVRRGEILLVIESEKVEFEVEAPADGVVRALVVAETTTVPCGEVLAVLTETREEAFDLDAFLAEQREAEASAAPRRTGRRPTRGAAGARTGERPVASPRARRLAAREGIDVATLEGSGPGGRVTESDVVRAVGALGPRIPVGEARIAYADRDGPEPCVLFLPGLGLDRIAFNPQLAELAGWRRLLAPDPRGTGASTDPGEDELTVERLAEDACLLLDALGLEQADWVGSSLGAAVAVEAARRWPERVRRLVLLSPPAEPDPRLAAALEGFCAAAESTDPELRVRVMAPWLFGRAFLAEAARRDRTLRALAGAAARSPARTLWRQASALRRWLEGAPEAYGAAGVPALVVVGADDPLTPPAHAERVARTLPDARLEPLKDVGHAPAVEAPDRLQALLQDFLGS